MRDTSDSNIPHVSVVMPAHNAAAFIADTISSALAQSLSHFELLIVDDGSTDETAAIARQFASRDPRIRIFTTVNLGASGARNIGMEQARGELIAFLDSDDLWSRDYLAQQTAILARHPEASVVTANATNLGGARDGTPFWPVTTGLRQLTFRDIVLEEDAVCIMSVFRRSVLDAAGGFDPAFITNEDYQFWLRIARLGFVILQNRTPLGQYRRRPGSLSDDERRMLSGIISVLRWARAESLEYPLDIAAIDTQIERFEKQLLFTSAKAHLIGREFDKAADAFSALSALDGRWASELIAQASRRAPGTLRLAYRGMTALRTGAAIGRVP